MLKATLKGNKRGELIMYDLIGDYWDQGITAKAVAHELRALGKVDDIDVRLNSPGGIVWEGIAIYSQLVQASAKIHMHIDGLAASAGSLVAMAGDDIEIAEAGFMMIHRPFAVVGGTADDLREAAERLDAMNQSIAKTYSDRSKMPIEDVLAAMTAETWYCADEAVEAGFADSVAENLKAAACILDPKMYNNVPDALINRQPATLTLEAIEAKLALAKEKLAV